MTTGDEPTRQLVEQRIRNRIIEYLRVASSFEEQREYQRNAPIAHVPNEMINQWEDWVPVDPRGREQSDVYSNAEMAALGDFHAVWNDVATRTPNPLPRIDETLALPEWEELRRAAASALAVFEERGTFSEDVEI